MMIRSRLSGGDVARLFGVDADPARRIRTRFYAAGAALFAPEFSVLMPKHRNVLAILGREDGSVDAIPGSNIVTTAGDVYYAQRGAAEAPTNTFNTHHLVKAWAASHPAKASDYSHATTKAAAGALKAIAAGYPKSNDPDTNNSGRGTTKTSWLADYTAGDFADTAIIGGLITVTTPGANAALLCGYTIASFDKASTDTLKVYVNHEAQGI